MASSEIVIKVEAREFLTKLEPLVERLEMVAAVMRAKSVDNPVDEAGVTNVYIVTVGGRVNSAWAAKQDAQEHYRRLLGVNGNQIGAAVQELELRTHELSHSEGPA